MALTSEQREQVEQIRKLAAYLNLSNDQRAKLRSLLERAMEKGQTYRTIDPNAPNSDRRIISSNEDHIRQQIVNFLTPEQLTRWDMFGDPEKVFFRTRPG